MLRLLQGAADNAFLLRSDFYAIRDWVEIAACGDQDVLHAILLLMLVAPEEAEPVHRSGQGPAPAAARAISCPRRKPLAWAQRIPQALDGGDFSALIGTSPRDHKPVIVHTVGTQRFLYFQKYLRAELDFHAELTQRLKESPASGTAAWPGIVQEVLAGQPLRLDRRAADGPRRLRLVNNLAVISGGPGTGKTSIVLTLLRLPDSRRLHGGSDRSGRAYRSGGAAA